MAASTLPPPPSPVYFSSSSPVPAPPYFTTETRCFMTTVVTGSLVFLRSPGPHRHGESANRIRIHLFKFRNNVFTTSNT
ncbi:unnamed protein product [Macrosiphum euphorbiae]|uniref:Uncharacterized protein n=1 Tax=Macrosiphum euphorbiae TaxID=13131 RepID=A0AAV0VVW1_9HEMI|nr:unnamed protein product [Macrosiphum euphorbiae]